MAGDQRKFSTVSLLIVEFDCNSEHLPMAGVKAIDDAVVELQNRLVELGYTEVSVRLADPGKAAPFGLWEGGS